MSGKTRLACAVLKFAMILSDFSVSFSHEGVVGEIGSRGVPGTAGDAVSSVL